MLKFKIDVIKALSEVGVTSYTCRKTKLIGQASFKDLREGKVPGPIVMDTICTALKMQPGDLLEWIPDPKDE